MASARSYWDPQITRAKQETAGRKRIGVCPSRGKCLKGPRRRTRLPKNRWRHCHQRLRLAIWQTVRIQEPGRTLKKRSIPQQLWQLRDQCHPGTGQERAQWLRSKPHSAATKVARRLICAPPLRCGGYWTGVAVLKRPQSLKDLFWFNKKLQKLTSQGRKLFKRAEKFGDWANYKEASTTCKAEVWQSKRATWSQNCDDIIHSKGNSFKKR